MDKSKEKAEARRLRSQGFSISEIEKKVEAARSTISLWVRDIELTQAQKHKLLQRSRSRGESARIRWAETQKRRRVREERRLRKEGIEEIGKLTDREFFLVGAALYWAEGYKSSGDRFGIVNSDPRMVLFMIEWMKRTFRLKNSDFIPRVGINIAHKHRAKEVERYWSSLTGIPVEQSRKTSFKHYKLRKKYKNFNRHQGTLSLEARKATAKVRKAWGWIEGLASSGPVGRIKKGRRSSVG